MPRFTITDRTNTSAFIDYELPVVTPPAPSYDWSESNLPWAYTSTSQWEQDLPAGVPVVPLSPTGTSFYERLHNTVTAATGRVIVRLPDGVHRFTQFKTIGSGGAPHYSTYAFGYWNPKLAGFVANGPDKCIVEMGPNAVSQAQLDHMKTMTQGAFIQLQMGLIRLDTEYNSAPAPIYLGGVGFEAAPQPLLTEVAADIVASAGVYVPQSAPHMGVVIYSSNNRRHEESIVTYCRFRGAGKAMMSQPPFELANISSQRNQIVFSHTEFDGRMSPRYDETRPRKCGVFMVNGGIDQRVKFCWMHHSNVSRYAANDEAVASTAPLSNYYLIEGVKLDQLTNNQNRQPPINNGNSLGGYTNVSNIGFESSNAKIEIVDCVVSVDNPYTSGQIACHIQLTNTGAARPGGRLYVKGGTYRHTVFPQLNGFVTFRIQQSTNWATDGYNNTLDVRLKDNVRLAPYQVTGTWPPTAAALQAAGVTPETHYLVRSA
jgi:hypothetical protein